MIFPLAFKISNIKTCISNDSLCVLQFTTKGRNGFGGFSTSRVEYVLVKDQRDVLNEIVTDLDDDDKKSIYTTFRQALKGEGMLYENLIENGYFNGKNMTTEQIAYSIAYNEALINSALYGREIENE